MKILCVLLPHFPVQCERLRQSGLQQREVVTYTLGSQKLVLDYSPKLHGLQRDMPLQQALSLHGDVELIHADAPYYWSAFNGILDSLETKSPLVEGTDLGEVYIGLDGLQLIYPGDDFLISAVREAIPDSFEALLGIAGGKFQAYLAALHSPPADYRVLAGNIESFLKDLSCDILPISIKSKQMLHEFGLHTIRQVSALLPGPLQAQFGPEGKRIWQLAKGQDDTPLFPRSTKETIEESTTLPSATVSLDVTLVALEAMLSSALAKLAPSGMGISKITLWTRTWMSEYWERSIPLKEPAMNVKTVISRIRQVMENSPQPGPVEQLGVKITGTARQRGRQGNLFSEVRAQDHLLNDIRQLEFRMGGPQLFTVKEVESWSRIPERRRALTPLSQ